MQSRALWTSGSTLNLASVLSEEIKVESEGYAKPQEIASGPPAPFTLTEEPADTLLTLKRTFQGEEIAVDLHVNNQPAQDYGEENTNEDGETLSIVAFNVTVTKGDSALVFECESDGTYVSISHLSHEPKDGHPSESYYTVRGSSRDERRRGGAAGGGPHACMNARSDLTACMLQGPVFAELDEVLQQELRAYLQERGITVRLRAAGHANWRIGLEALHTLLLSVASLRLTPRLSPCTALQEELGEYLRHLIYDKEQREYMAWLKKVHAFVK
jgi:complement component 1 Q subcomponent-binding protein